VARAFILVLDSFGIGSAPDAEKYGDKGANTLLHIAEACAAGKANNQNRSGGLHIPNMRRMGLEKALELACGQKMPEAETAFIGGDTDKLIGAYAVGQEISAGKDTPSGHWEMMGLPVMQPWGVFHKPKADDPAYDKGSWFPRDLLQSIYRQAELPGSLANCAASGTRVIAGYGEESVRTGKPIFYTSADSVFQVAAHEEAFGLARLYSLCEIIRKEMDKYNVGRVIARPFTGDAAAGFQRTHHRRDWTTPPQAPTLFDAVQAEGGATIAIGKIADIFAHKGISKELKAYGTRDLFFATREEADIAPDNSLIMTNFVDFDQTFGHRRDIAGYAAELELFDSMLPNFWAAMRPDDLLVLTADHGCDPTWHGNDHTREFVPQLLYGAKIKPVCCGKRIGFADMGQSVASWMGAEPLEHGISYMGIALGEKPPVKA